jgi:hypothetical protein
MYKTPIVLTIIITYTKVLKFSKGLIPVGFSINVGELINEVHLNFVGTNKIIQIRVEESREVPMSNRTKR